MMKLLFDLKIDFENQNVVIFYPAYTSHSKFYRVYYCWFHFLGKSLHLVGCVLQKWGHAKRQHRVVCQCSVSTVTPFLRIGARHRAFFSSLDLWRLVQETILYFQQLQWAVSFRLQNQWTLKFVTIATLCYI